MELSRNPRVSGRVIPGHPLWRHYDLINSFDCHTFKRTELNPRGCEEAGSDLARRSMLSDLLSRFHVPLRIKTKLCIDFENFDDNTHYLFAFIPSFFFIIT